MFDAPCAIHAPYYALETDSVDLQIQEVRAQIEEYAASYPQVLQGYDDLIHCLRERSEFHMQRLLDALAYAAEQYRLDVWTNLGDVPYIIHPMKVAQDLVEIGNIREEDVIVGALLHGVIDEKLPIEPQYEQISQAFGPQVVEYIREVSNNDPAIPKGTRKLLEVEYAPSRSKGATAIILADKLYSLRDLAQPQLVGWSEDRIDQYLSWVRQLLDHLPETSPGLKAAVEKALSSDVHSR